MSKTYKCTLNMEGHGKSKSAAKKKKVVEKENMAKEEETGEKQEDEVLKVKSPKEPSVKEVEDDKEGAEKKKKREDQSVRLFHDDTFKGLFLLKKFQLQSWNEMRRFLPKALLE